MYPSSHSRAALSSPEGVFSVTFSGLLESPWKMYFSGLLESLESPSECGVSHIVMFITWLLESPSGCEIAHISSSGIFATPTLRNRSGPSPGPLRTPPAFGGTPSGFEIAPLRASGALPVGWPGRGRLRRSEGPSRASEGHPSRRRGPRRSGGLRAQSAGAAPGRIFAHAQLTSAAL